MLSYDIFDVYNKEDVGIQYLKKKDIKALFQLTKEERTIFKKFVLNKIKNIE
jgi:hypothetical protein